MSGGGLIPAILAGLALRGSGLLNRRRDRGGATPQRDPDDPGHEPRDVNVRNAALAMAGLALSALVVIGLMVWLMGTFGAAQRRALPTLSPEQTARLTPPAPNLQADPYADLDRERASVDAQLSGYGYTDAAHTRARIPIARAMQRVTGRPLDPVEGGPR